MDSPDDVTVIPHTTIRRRIAKHMVMSQSTSAHAFAMIDVDYGAIDVVRGTLGARWKEECGYSLSYLPFVARAVLLGIGQFPKLNARFADSGLEVLGEIGLGIAVDLEFEGLVVPVIPQAGSLHVPELASTIHELADRTRQGKLTSNDVSGGTVTVSNPGPFGARITVPIINQPQVAILTIDAIALRPAVSTDAQGNPSLVVRPIGNLTLAWDHRAFDGAYATSALTAIRATLESHDWRSEFGSSWFSPAQSSSSTASMPS